MKNEQKILQYLHLAEKLKAELRHSWLSNGRQESSAEHSWRLALMVLLIAPETNLKLDIFRALKMATIHDLVEAEAHDIPAFEKGRAQEKKQNELKAAKKFKEMLSNSTGDEIFDLWQEYEERETPEAKFVKALDNLEARLQHNESDLSTWVDIEYPRSLYAADKSSSIDNFVSSLNYLIKQKSRQKIINGKKDLASIECQAEKLKNE